MQSSSKSNDPWPYSSASTASDEKREDSGPSLPATLDPSPPVYKSVDFQAMDQFEHDQLTRGVVGVESTFDPSYATPYPFSKNLLDQPHSHHQHTSVFSKETFADQILQVLPSASTSERPEPPAPKGGYLEPLHHVLLAANADPTHSFIHCLDSLREQGVDCVSKDAKFKIDCCAYHEGAKLTFKVRVYSLPKPKYCMEFQRRSGNSMRFSQIYRACLLHLDSRRLLAEEAMSCLPPAPPVPAAAVSFDTAKAADAVDSLRQMASSSYIDVVCEAVRALSELASDPSLQPTLLAGGILEVFIEGVRSESEDLRRCAVTGCANLADRHAAACRELVRVGCVRLILETIKNHGADGQPKDYTPQLVREMARLLVNVRKELGRDMLASAQTEALQAHEKMCHSSDAIVRQHADMLSDILRGPFDTAVH
jgi:hypothetical protein